MSGRLRAYGDIKGVNMIRLMIFISFGMLIGMICIVSAEQEQLDVVIRNGLIYDGSGSAPVKGDLAIRGDRVIAVGKVTGKGAMEIDAKGMAVSPGFINMLSWATESLIEDGHSQSDIRQG